MEIGKFGTGKLEVGKVIMAYGHPHDYLASGCVGKNFYPCFANITTNLGNLTCKNHEIDHLSRQSRFKVMEDVWNLGSITRAEKEPDMYGKNLDFEKNLLARLPIIQAGGMVCGSGAFGASIFNFDNEIVGMHVYGVLRI
ncbi:hypothetical protein L195_g005008 [Trifolium pratense]|uniref:Uncharacterized protein n=1 Tax=Trifolium pratense TaxID=57577 RepID=A0A2K3NZL7_TRIPR|nr:hypothetical protein L195_g005008 [Trifolium pratense]